VIPETILGIIAFAAGVGPGYLFVQLAERYGPRRDRTQLEEAAELLVVGSAATAGSLLLVLWATSVETGALIDDPARYVLSEPRRALLLFGLTLVLSYFIVWLVTTKAVYRGKPRDIEPGGTMWYAAFRRLVPEGHGTLVTIERKDGSAITGLLGSATADESASREILVIAPENRPIYARATRQAEAHPLRDTFVIVAASDIDLVAGHYLPITG
jgi:hypothetical protein